MTHNVGSIDRTLRVIAGLALLSAIFWMDGPNRWFGLIGLVPLLTATVRFCPLYALIGLSTGGSEDKR
jgi:hypothetical protein